MSGSSFPGCRGMLPTKGSRYPPGKVQKFWAIPRQDPRGESREILTQHSKKELKCLGEG
jgi:hypothetical protein